MMFSLSPDDHATGAITEEADGPILSPTADEVHGSTLSLVEMINRGDIEPPENPFTWMEWTQWRAAEGSRPRLTGAFSKRESRLWRTTMASLFGEGWNAELAAVRERAALHDNRITDQGEEVSSPSEGHSPSTGGRRVWRSPKRTRPGGEEGAVEGELQSSAGSEGSWRNMSNEDVEAMLTDAFRVNDETLVDYERRIARARAVLQLRGIASDANAAHRAVQAARLADRYQKSGGLAALHNEIAEALDKNDQDEYLDSLVSAVQLLGGEGVRKILRPTVRPKAGPSARIASPRAGVLSQPAIPPSSPCRPAEDLAEAFEDALSEASRTTETVPANLVREMLDAAKHRTKSTIQIKPDVSWPSLNDCD